MELLAARISEAPKIDGKLDDACWQGPGRWEGHFTQNFPDNGKPSSQQTRVQIRYSDYGIYIGALLYDTAPDSIQRELGLRDEEGRNVDRFGVAFDTYRQRQNAFGFIVSAAGVQSDRFITPNGEDFSWNTVWRSAVSVHEAGWTVEIEIPWNALRFPKAEDQVWGINFVRWVQRRQEVTFWNPVDANINGLVTQFGDLQGLQGIKPPLRLQLFPYTSAYLLRDGNEGKWGSSFNAGMDIKLGINEAFTLDVTTIPDFGQVLSDNVVYNISPFEVRFNENRQFFTEGAEIFNKGSMFYSRRIGASFVPASVVQQRLQPGETLGNMPTEARLLNAAKFSGRTPKGLGIGVLNAITNPTYAIATDSLGNQRQVEADPLTNFNMAVLDKNLPYNSNIALINTNVSRANGGPDANVSSLQASLFDKKNTYNLSLNGILSQRWPARSDSSGGPDLGHAYYLSFAKVSGRLQYRIARTTESHNLNLNDFGFLAAPNEVNHSARISWVQNTPRGITNRKSVTVWGEYNRLHRPAVFVNAETGIDAEVSWKNFWYSGVGLNVTPSAFADYFEALRAGDGWRAFLKPASGSANLWWGTDSRKAFYVDGFMWVWNRPEWKQLDNGGNVSIRYRFNNRFTLSHNFNPQWRRREIGYATRITDSEGKLQEIVMGRRGVQTLTNTLSGSYTFNEWMGLNLRVRHYWSKVAYDKFYSLDTRGEIQPSNYDGWTASGVTRHDANFNAFNIDLVYSWQFVPGSFMSVVWKSAVFTFNNDTQPNFVENVGTLLQSPANNSFSVRILYFLDYLQIRKWLT